MFKFGLKIALLSLVLIGTLSLFSTGSAAAATCNWAPGNPNSPPAMGFHHGEADDNFAGLVVKARVGNMTNGATDDSGHQNQLVNVAYRLHSQLPAPGSGNHYYNPGNSQNINARIFTLDASGNPIDRTDITTFRTGETLYAPGSSFSCDGFSALGPGTSQDEVGNRTGIDCGQEVLQDGTNNLVRKELSRYWIDNIPNAFGQDGYWDINIKDANGNVTNTYRNGTMDYNTAFQVANGDTKYVDLVWHKTPNPPPKGGGDIKSECTYLDVNDSGSATINGNSFNSNAVRTLVRVTDDSGKVLVHGSDSQNDPVILNDAAPPPGAGAWNPNTGHGQWSYTPNSATVHVNVHRQYWHNNSGTWRWDQVPAGSTYGNGNPLNGDDSRDHYNCYSATCTLVRAYGNIPDSNAPSNGVVQNTQFAIQMKVTNTGPVTLSNPSLTGATGISNVPLNQNEDGYTWAYPTAPGGAQNYTMNFTLNDVVSNLATCSVTVPVYQQFTAGLAGDGVTLSPTTENPNNAHYDTKVNVTPSSPAVHIPTTMTFSEIPAGSVTPTTLRTNSGGNYPPPSYAGNSGDWPITSVSAGDQYCVNLHADYTAGLVGPGGPNDIYATYGVADFNPGCRKVVNQPYTHFFGNDVSAGGGFGSACHQDSKGVIYAYNEASDGAANAGNAGSGVQFGAHAMDIISGLGSASLRNTSPVGLSGLSFANTANGGGSPPAKPTGGFLGNAALSNFCVPDYFNDKPSSVPSDNNTTANVGSAGLAQQWHKVPRGGTLTLNGGTIPNGMNQVIFIEPSGTGTDRITVNIIGGIKYQDANDLTNPRNSVTKIPSFYLVVKGGNIHIDKDVTQLDGAYIAQPDTTNAATINKTGIINTCYVGNDTSQIYNLCKKQLVVNGAFVANRVLLARSYSSLRFSQGGENNMSGSPHNCGNSGKDVFPGTSLAQDCASEIFNFSPELYLSQPAINARFGTESRKYDAITSLSPVL